MLKERFAALNRRFVTLEDGRYGRLVGEGDASSIRIDGAPNQGALLAFHGFAGTPNEVRLLTEVASRLGLSARAPRLPGHENDVRPLLLATWDDWAYGAEAAFSELVRAARGPLIVAGISMGSLLAVRVAVQHADRVAGLIVLSNAIRLAYPSPALILQFCDKVRPLANAFYVPKAGADIRDAEARRRHLTYDVTPVRSAVEVLRAGRATRTDLPRVTCPTLVIHGALDQVCPVANAERFAHSLGTRDVQVAILPHSGHIVTADYDRAEVARLTEQFVRRVVARS
jgi:carboxylesterase